MNDDISNKIRHVWFDVAGTLYKETPEFQVAHDQLRYTTYAKLVGQQDMDKAREEYEALYAKYHSNSAVFRSLGQPSDFWQNAFDELDVEELLRPDSEITETLKAISGQLPVSLFTNFKRKKILSLLQHLQISADYFTHILDGDAVKVRKPDLEGFHKIIELSGAPADQILYVGDRVDVDIKPAKQLGIRTCLVYGQSDEADYGFNEFGDLLTLFR